MDTAALARLISQRYQRLTGNHHNEENEFAKKLRGLINTALVYDNDGLPDEALEVLPLERLYNTAEERSKDETWGMQDYLIMELLKWFKQEYFTWVNSPKCYFCESETNGIGSTRPNDEEVRDGAGVVELYNCKNCGETTRFPRYNHPRKLLSWRKGRCGEWANCFSLLCRSLGSRTRWVWNHEDHVWTEVYSERQKRWIHVDSCEEAWDKPTLYSEGWGKKMSYVIGYSIEGAADVTKRYIRNPSKALPRNQISESQLVEVLNAITKQQRFRLSENEVAILQQQDKMEQIELDSYSASTKTSGIGPRESGKGEWTKMRGEDGQSQ